MSSIVRATSSASSPTFLPTKREWNALLSFQEEKLKTDRKLFDHSRINGLKECDWLYNQLLLAQFTQPTKDLHERLFRPLTTFAGFSQIAFTADYRQVKNQMCPSTHTILDHNETYHFDIERTKRYVTAYTTKVEPYLVTVHKVICCVIELFKKIEIGSLEEDYGFIPDPASDQKAFVYIRNEGLHFPFYNSEDPNHFPNKFHSLPIFYQISGLPLQRYIVMQKGHQPNCESGYVVKMGVDNIPGEREEDLRKMIELIPIQGFDGIVSLARCPYSLGAMINFPNHPTTQFISMLVPLDQITPRYEEFFPFPSNLDEQQLASIELLKAFIEICEEPLLIQEAVDMISSIEKELMDRYQHEFEEKIQLEQKERSRLVTSGEINEINKTAKKKKSKKSKEKLIEAPKEEEKSVVKPMLDPRKQAKIRFDVGQKRIKSHKFVGFINRLKKALKQQEFQSLLTQNGSHITLHGDEKESVTAVIPHKKDGTTSSKLITRFITKVHDFFKLKGL